MGKAPATQFYWADWLRDPALRSVSYASRGLWMDMLCLMHFCPRRGYLEHATGKPVTPEQVARMTGGSLDEVSRLLQELIDSGVCSVSEHGVIYSRRMVRETRISKVRSEVGKKGAESVSRVGGRFAPANSPANPPAKPPANPRANAQQNTGSSSSSSTSNRNRKEGWLVDGNSPRAHEAGSPPQSWTESEDRRDAGSAEVEGDQPGEDSGEGVQVEGRAGSARNRGIAESGCPDWCEPDVWAEAERLTELIETADHPEPVVLADRDGVRRTVHVARTLQDAGRATVLALAPEGVARTIEALCRPSSALSARLADIAGKLRKYPNATYPNLDGTGRRRNPSMLEEAHRLLTMGERFTAPESRRGGGFRKLAETRP